MCYTVSIEKYNQWYLGQPYLMRRLRVLRITQPQALDTGILWNLSSCEASNDEPYVIEVHVYTEWGYVSLHAIEL